MSSDSSLLSPKPNPKTNPKIPEPDKFNPNKLMSQNKEMNIPNWSDLPEEIWSIILSKVSTVDIIESVEIVCKLFRKICKQPSMYNVIDMTLPDEYIDDDDSDYVNSMTLFAVDRSSGNLVDIYLETFCDDETLMAIVQRSRNLKHLRLGHHIDISDRELVEAVKRLPMLEEVELNFSCFHEKTIETVGRACPSLKSFSVNNVWPENHKCNREVMAIAKSMPNLHNLQLIGSYMTNEGLKAILDGCPLLESLDIRDCFHLDLSGDLGKRCEQIKHFRPPSASLEHFIHQACKCDADDSHTPSLIEGYLLCNRGSSSFSTDNPDWDDDLEFIDHDNPDYYYGYDNVYDYAHAGDLQPQNMSPHVINEFPSQMDLQEFIDNDDGDEEYPDWYCDCCSGISSPSYSPPPPPDMDYDEWIDSMMP